MRLWQKHCPKLIRSIFSDAGPSRPKARAGAGRPLLERSGVSNLDVTYVSNETELINEFINLVKK